MSHSRKDGRKGGAHRGGHWGREYWTARPGPRMAPWGSKWAKVETHRAERREAKAECVEADA